jgi:biotin carboxyl carrier protein
MRYFVKLDDQEFSLALHDGHTAQQATLSVPDGTAMLTQILSPARHGRPALVSVDGQMFRVFLSGAGSDAALRAVPAADRASINGRSLSVSIETELERRARPIRHTTAARDTRILAPMPGRIVKVSVRQGDLVSSGAPVLSIEAMKMENELHAPCPGRIAKLHVQVGDTVDGDQELIVMEPEE